MSIDKETEMKAGMDMAALAEQRDDERQQAEAEAAQKMLQQMQNSAKDEPAKDNAAKAQAEEDEKRRAHEEAEAKRKAEWEEKQRKRKEAEQAAWENAVAMDDDQLLKASVKRLGDDAERVTRRNMKQCVTEYIQTHCYLIVKNGEADLSVCDSLDNGIITLYNRIKSKVNADYDMLLDESDIDAILRELPVDYDENIIRIVNEQAQAFIIDLFGKLRERMIDLRSGKAVFVGGGSILLKKHIEASGKVSLPIFVDEISANTKGYELLFKAACMG